MGVAILFSRAHQTTETLIFNQRCSNKVERKTIITETHQSTKPTPTGKAFRQSFIESFWTAVFLLFRSKRCFQKTSYLACDSDFNHLDQFHLDPICLRVDRLLSVFVSVVFWPRFYSRSDNLRTKLNAFGHQETHIGYFPCLINLHRCGRVVNFFFFLVFLL